MRAYFNRNAFIGSVVLLMGLYGCATTATAPIVEVQENQEAPDAPARVLNPAIGGTQTSPVVERRFKIEALGFKCLDESWYDSPFFTPWISDEVIVLIRDPARRVISLSRVFGDVDTGESRSFESDENCVLPIDGLIGQSDTLLVAPHNAWACSSAGIPGPFSFTVEMHEEDGGIFHDCILNFPFGCTFTGVGIEAEDNEELIGRRTLEFTAEALAAAMPNVNDTFDETITLGPCHDERGCVESPGLPTGPEYTFTYRLTRLPDTPVVRGIKPSIP
jgi:hypothetical protein